MKISTATELIGALVYKPGWSFDVTDHCHRFEDTIRIRINYPARNSNRSDAANGYPENIDIYAEFAVCVSNVDDVGLYHALVEAIVNIETHEVREFLRVKPTLWAPFHPHLTDGMRRWAAVTGGRVEDDLKFGVC